MKDKENYMKESNCKIYEGEITFEEPLNDNDNKYSKLKNDLFNFLIIHQETSKSKNLGNIYRSSKHISANKVEINCKLHNKEFLLIDSAKFKVECSKCLENGEGKKNLQLNEEQILTPYKDEVIHTILGLECYMHLEVTSDFYCEDCKVFLCKICFANLHRSHSCDVLSEIANKFKLSIQDISYSINELKPKLEEGSKSLSEIYKQLKTIRKNHFDEISSTSTKINSIINNKYQKFLSRFETLFLGNDLETESAVKRLDSKHKTVYKYLIELNEISNIIDSKQNDIEICKFIKAKHHRLQEIKNTIDEKKNFLFYSVNNIKNKVQANIQDFNGKIENLNKHIKIYLSSVISSINTGISSSSLRLRRFSNMKCNTKYFKTSGVECQFSGSICLVGLGLCGLYAGHNENNGKLNEKKTEIFINNKNLLKISISEIRNHDDIIYDNLLAEEHFLTSIVNSNDPIISIYFNKAVILKQDRRYLIQCTNMNKDVLIPRWYGEVSKSSLKNKSQFVLCNTSRIGFTFSETNGIESDLDEYCSGIVAEFIFSYI